MHVLEAGEVSAYGDQVQPLLVLDVVGGDRSPVGAAHGERQRDVSSCDRLRIGHLERESVLGDHQSSWDVRLIGGRRIIGHGRRALGVLRPVGLSRRPGRRADGLPGAYRDGEHRSEDDQEAADLDGGAHASW
jgi:hypothetical protein